MKSVTIVDYGLGNLRSVANAMRRVGAQVEMDSDGRLIRSAERLIVPGVGAYADGMKGLHERGQAEAIRDYAERSCGTLLGICLGMQLLFDSSRELGITPGLGILPGTVERVPECGEKIPHVGWKQLRSTGNIPANPLATEGAWVYFVHSYHARPSSAGDVTAVASYGKEVITASVARGLVHGFQFHPETSGDTGLHMLESFLNL